MAGAWGYARRHAAQNRAGAQAANASHQRVGGYDATHADLCDRFQSYDFERQKCFFCGARAHHTGYFAGYGAIWLCKERCENKYSLVVMALAE